MIRFSKYWWIYSIISSLVIIPGVISLFRFGLRPSVDFTGGTYLDVTFEKPLSEPTIMEVAKKQDIEVVSITPSGKQSVAIRLKSVRETMITAFETAMQKESNGKMETLKKETVGPILGKELLEKTVVASVFVLIAILSYVAYAFKNIRFGVSAIIALTHDMLVMFGSFSLLGYFLHVEVDTLFVTAFLTTMSFSVHDTIVIFDRIREYQRRDHHTTDIQSLSDVALTETMGRSLVNSFTIIFMLLSLVLIGGDSVKWFAVALLIGIITGTYSSPFVATPILLLWDVWERRKKK